MAFCGKCGAQYEEGTRFCPSCGAPTEQQTQQSQAQQQTNSQANAGTDFTAKLSALNDTKDSTAEFDKNDIEQNKVMAILAYLSWLVLIPLFAAKNSKFARYHVNQGIILAVVETIWAIATLIITSIGSAIAWWIGSFFSTVMGIANIAFFALFVIGLINVLNGKAKELPIIGKYRIIK